MSFTVAVVGATGAVGREMLRILEQRKFPISRLVLLASPKSAGKRLPFMAEQYPVHAVSPEAFQGVQLALFSAGSAASRELAPMAAQAGAIVIDNSSAWRMDPDVPLVVPEVNLAAARNRPKNIIANPNCSTIQMVVALKPLHDAAKIEHIVVSTYQATSGKGQAAVDDLVQQSRAALEGKPFKPAVFPGPIAFNVLCDWDPGQNDYSEEELKMVFETRKIMGDESIAVSPTCVRVPVLNGHSESVFVRFKRPMDAEEAKSLLRNAPGVALMEEPYSPGRHPQPLAAAGSDAVHVGRVRNDVGAPGCISMFVVADNLRKGAALNAIQIAEHIAAGRA